MYTTSYSDRPPPEQAAVPDQKQVSGSAYIDQLVRDGLRTPTPRPTFGELEYGLFPQR